jgi:hypothetical protein
MIKLRTSKIEDDITAIKESSRNVYKKYNMNRDSTHRPEAAFPSQCQQSRLQSATECGPWNITRQTQG